MRMFQKLLNHRFWPLFIKELNELRRNKRLVAMMLLRPEGLFPSRQRARELHTSEGEDSIEASPTGLDSEGTLA